MISVKITASFEPIALLSGKLQFKLDLKKKKKPKKATNHQIYTSKREISQTINCIYC